MRKYRVLTASKRKPTAWVVDAKNVSKSKAKRIAKKERGWFWGAGKGSPHHKVGNVLKNVPKKYKKEGHLYRTYSKIVPVKAIGR